MELFWWVAAGVCVWVVYDFWYERKARRRSLERHRLRFEVNRPGSPGAGRSDETDPIDDFVDTAPQAFQQRGS